MEKQKKAQRPEEVRARIKQLIQQTMQEALEGELDDFLGYPKHGKAPADNTRNGHSEKTVQTDTGPIELKVPRDRDSEFEPQLVRKRQTILDDLEDKVVALYAKGMTTRDIQDILGDMYGTALSPSLISRITDRVMPRLQEWLNRPLKSVYGLTASFMRSGMRGRSSRRQSTWLSAWGLTAGKSSWASGWTGPRARGSGSVSSTT